MGANQGPGAHRAVCEFGGVGSIEMLFRSNLFAIVGGGDFPCFSPEKVLIWDDHQCKWIGELGFHSKVLGVRLRRDKIVVALKNKVSSTDSFVWFKYLFRACHAHALICSNIFQY